uniref:CSON013879 protein n=1 Tax=Culicoides sonorensis TaxID=179676 RepID=A0A336M8Y3_CULSO
MSSSSSSSFKRPAAPPPKEVSQPAKDMKKDSTNSNDTKKAKIINCDCVPNYVEKVEKNEHIPEPGTPCDVCGLNEVDDILFGPLMKQEGICAHYFCLLFSYELEQTGCEIKDVAGFKVSDIKECIKDSRKHSYKCVYCKKPYPTAVCCVKTCTKRFHVPCGMKNNALMRFFGSYETFCDTHAKELIVRKELPPKNQRCLICMEDLGEYNPVSCFQPKCCIDKIKKRKDDTCWMHYRCVMEGVRSLGYYFNCFAYCCAENNEETKQYYLDCGIFIPTRDAMYENKHYFDDIDVNLTDEDYLETTYDEDATLLQQTLMENEAISCDYKERCIGAKLGKNDILICSSDDCENFAHVKCLRYARHIKSNELTRAETFFCRCCLSKSCLALI